MAQLLTCSHISGLDVKMGQCECMLTAWRQTTSPKVKINPK